jgi:5-methylcytosine-specific restriction endonuclease McrA
MEDCGMRHEFTKATKREALKRSGGYCEASGDIYTWAEERCIAPLAHGVEFDHILACSNGGDNSLGNCAAVCKKCHAFKTTKFDTPRAAKTKRMRDKHLGIKNAKYKWPKGRKFGT